MTAHHAITTRDAWFASRRRTSRIPDAIHAVRASTGELWPVVVFCVAMAVSFDVMAAGTGSICIAPVANSTMGTKSLANSTASVVPYDFTISFDGGAPVVVSHDTTTLIPNMSIASRHSVRIEQAGVAQASFRFRFSDYDGRHLCLWFNPLYETWSLSLPGNMPWCRCPR